MLGHEAIKSLTGGHQVLPIAVKRRTQSTYMYVRRGTYRMQE